MSSTLQMTAGRLSRGGDHPSARAEGLTGRVGGMTAASVLGIFTVPAIFYLMERWSAAARERFLKPATQHRAIAEGKQDA